MGSIKCSRSLRAILLASPPNTLRRFLQSLVPGGANASTADKEHLASMVPASVRRHMIRQWVAKVNEHWTPLKCAYVKVRCVGSNAKWLRLLNILFRTWREDTPTKKGRHVTLYIDDVAVPRPKGVHTMKKVRHTAQTDSNVQVLHSGLVSYRPLVPRVHVTWPKLLSSIVSEHGEDALHSHFLQSIIFNPLADKARARGARAGVTAIGVRIGTPILKLPNSMACVNFVSYGEHDDSNEDLHYFAKPTLVEINDLFKAGSININGTVWPIQPRLSLDGLCLSGCFCHGSFRSLFPCPLCRIKKEDLMDIRLSVATGATKRTIQSIRLMSHRQATGNAMCEGCGLYVCHTDDEVRERGGPEAAIRVCRDGDFPERPWTSKKRTVIVDGKQVTLTQTWEQWHYGIKYGQEVVFFAEPQTAILCNLHRKLQTLPLIISGTVARYLDPDWKEQSEGPSTQALCAVVSHFGRDVMPLEEPAKFPTLTGGRTLYGRHGRLAAGVRVDGNTERCWVAGHEQVLDIVFDDRAEKKKRMKRYERSMAIWEAYISYNHLLTKPYAYPRVKFLCSREEVSALWEQRAREVEVAAVRFLELFRANCPGLGEGSFYLHAMLAHVPDNVRLVGRVDEYSTEGMEAGHTWMNETLVKGTNSIKHERMKQVMASKVTEEYIYENDGDVAAAVDREETKKEHIKETRVKAAKRRATERLEDVRTADKRNSEQLKNELLQKKLARRADKLQARRTRTPTSST